MAKRFNENYDDSIGSGKIDTYLTKEQAYQKCEEMYNEASSEKDPTATYSVNIGSNDDSTFAIVMCYLDRDGAEYMGYDPDEYSDFLLAKFAYQPDDSYMSEYDMDWLMPYPVNEYGDVYDTETSVYSVEDLNWIIDQAYKFIDDYNANVKDDDDDFWDDFDDEESDLYEGCGSKKKKKKVLNQKKVCGEDRMYDLTPQKRDSRKSFYGKAKVVDKGNGEYELISYNTPVACVKDGKVVYADLRKWSATTDRHIREFLAQFCDECDL